MSQILPSNLLLVEPGQLNRNLNRLKNNDTSLTPAFTALRQAADRALTTPLLSVTQKKHLAPSGDPHDYLSMGPYWWLNPATPDGLPYIRRDGEKNPETAEYDSPRLKQLANAVSILAWAGYFSGEVPYLQHAARLVRAWFLDEATRMNPHLDYGQFIPGVCEGRGIGIIDTATVMHDLLDSIQVLLSTGSLTPEEGSALRAWMGAYRDWNINSANGKDEAVQHNNHGTWYDEQLTALALFTGQAELAARVCGEARERRINSQIQPDGSQPHELARTRSFSYSLMNLEGFLNLAVMAKRIGVDLLNYESGDGRGIRRALEWLRPYAAQELPWTGLQITPVDPNEIMSLYRQAGVAFNEPSFEQVLDAWPQESRTHLAQLLWSPET